MTDDEMMALLRALPRRSGLERFARMLGFNAALRQRRVPHRSADTVRGMLTTRRDGLHLHVVRTRMVVTRSAVRAVLGACAEEDPADHHIAVLLEPRGRRVTIACDVLGNGLRAVILEPAALRAVDLELARELARCASESGTAAAFAVMRALDRRTLTALFFRDVRSMRDLVARSWTGVPVAAPGERNALALLLLSRLLFLYFLQRDRLLADDERFLPGLLSRWQRSPGRGSFYRSVLRTLFFGVLNRRPERRTRRAAALGRLPYLNGGLFEAHRLELQYPRLDLPDEVTSSVFASLLERYRFTPADAGDRATEDVGGGIDPELLGRIFEGLMPGEKRSSTGTFYTPADVVDRLVTECLVQHFSANSGAAASGLRRLFRGEPHDLQPHEIRAAGCTAASLRVLDPACGSGAFLLAMLARVAQVRTAAGELREDRVRRDIVSSALHGVDLLDDAALICALRMWLALVPRCATPDDVPPLPNLDRCIRQGDALIDPLDGRALLPGDRRLRLILLRLERMGREYVTASPERRPRLRRTLRRLETALARAWITTARSRACSELAELQARARDRDLFGEPSTAAVNARRRLPGAETRVRQLAAAERDVAASGTLPFFSFAVHFAARDAGFDLVLTNPPWIRAHGWPAATSALLRERYVVCQSAGWPYASQLTANSTAAGSQVDLAFLFLERSVRLLRDGGTLGMVLPAKLLRSLAPGGARALLLSDPLITRIEDHSLDQRAVFAADAFTTAIVARRSAAIHDSPVHVRMTRSGVPDLEFAVERRALPLRAGDPMAPWLLAPPECAAALRTLQRHGSALGELGLSVRRGAMTAANRRMLLSRVAPRLGGLVEIASVDGASGIVEAACVRPVLRGADVRAWHATHALHVLWSPANERSGARVPPKFNAFVGRHVSTAQAHHDGRLQRISPGMFGHKVVWSDLSADLRAAAVPATVRSCGAEQPLIPLNTVYFIPVADADSALLLSAYLNALPLRTFARAIAERAKDAHFRFFSWTIAMLPLPADWQSNAYAPELVRIARRAHGDGGIDPPAAERLDALVAQAFGLTSDAADALASFDLWLKGVSCEESTG